MNDGRIPASHRWGILHQLFQRDESLAKLVEQVPNQILEAQVTEQLQAATYERTETIVQAWNERDRSEFLAWLKGWGLRGVGLIVSDDYGDLAKAIEDIFKVPPGNGAGPP